jgi:thiamine pyrophosphokinase
MSQIEKQKKERPLKKALIICNGNPPPQTLLKRLWREADYRVAADGGANLLHVLNLLPDAVVGDFDSLHPDLQKQLPDTILFHVKEQDTNDADKAVRHCLKLGFTEINLLGADGGRQDQFLSILEILFKYAPLARLIIWTPLERLEFILDTWKESLPQATTLSLLPLFGGAQGVVSQGLKFELNNHALLPGKSPSGVSNEVLSNPVTVSIQEGQLLLVLQHNADPA